ncbi:hypothetical protein KBK19_10850 [Microvirga sp. STR05]|uniref:Lipoprotein n=1 Tax=Hymenobacter duratus TaxID=2771356 RepID=A0ABR8JI57_9BACT|nr:hypothetical protein [Hymenobacter duratus]MBD2715535.1 hypothetical protein [Hymenobacter duratus]MBR7950443.1 hypothetical protein [Microvirga sp. STR05]
MYLPRLATAALVLCSAAACSEGPARRPASASETAQPDTAAVRKVAQEYRVHYNTPVALDSTDFYYQPISVVAQDASSRSRILSSSSYGSDYEGNTGIEGTCYNVLFFQKSTRQEQALLPHGRFVIMEIDAEKKPDVRWPYLFYTIVKDDTNADGDQDGEDASALFVSERSGRQLRQLTPDGTRLESRLLLPKTSLLLAEVRPDVNRDGKFTHADGTYWLRFDLANLAAAPVRQPAPALANALHQQMLLRQSKRHN